MAEITIKLKYFTKKCKKAQFLIWSFLEMKFRCKTNKKHYNKMGKSKRIHIVPNEDGWAVKRENSLRASAVTETKAEADAIARQIAHKEHGEVIIHGKNGKIQDSDSFGFDPAPPIDKKH